MGKKRRHHDDSEDEIRRKIRKLEDKLVKRRRRILRVLSDSSDSEVFDDYNGPSLQSTLGGYGTPSQLSQHSGSSPHPDPLHSSQPEESPQRSLRSAVVTVAATQGLSPVQSRDVAVPGTSTEGEICTNEIQLDDDILQLLGDAPKVETALGPPIHKDIANRWQEILLKGLEKEAREKLLKDYLVPNNCELLMAPTLNPEAKAALSEPLVKRDFTIMQKQKQIGIALSALATAMESILNNETSKQMLLKPISDGCRILCDSHFIESRTRRNFVISAINTDLKDTLIDTIRDKQLFGENVTEKIKSAQTIQKSGQVLKNVPKTNTFQGKNLNFRANTNSKNRLNFKSQHRRTDYKQNNATDAAKGRPTHRQTRPPAAPARSSTTRRSPIRKTYRK